MPSLPKAMLHFLLMKTIRSELEALLKELTFLREESELPQDLAGKTFVITGSLLQYPNRDTLKKEIEDRGGKVAGSVSAKTSYLINNDSTSTSGKNKKARELGIPVITEEEYSELSSEERSDEESLHRKVLAYQDDMHMSDESSNEESSRCR